MAIQPDRTDSSPAAVCNSGISRMLMRARRTDQKNRLEPIMSHENATAGQAANTIADRVPRDLPAAREIGFAVPESYNASAILFDNIAVGRGGRVVLRGDFGTLTYADLCTTAARFGHALLARGLARGDRVLLLLDDTPAYPAAIFGAIRAGLVPVLVNTQSPADLVAYYLEDSAAKLAVVEAPLAGLLPDRPGGLPLEAAVVAKPDEKWGETPCAFLELKPGVAEPAAEDIIAFCRGHMARFKAPRHVVFGPLPKTSTGKVQKFVLRERAKEI